MDNQPTTSYFDLGVLRLQSIKTGNSMKWMNTIDKKLWAQNIEGIAIAGDYFYVKKAFASFSSGQTAVLMPSETYKNLLPKLFISGAV